jgi:transketolase
MRPLCHIIITMTDVELIERLTQHARNVRRQTIAATTAAGSGHPTSSFSETEILVSLFFSVLKHDPSNPSWEARDRFVLSKGHGAPGLFAVLAEAGYIPPEELLTLRKLGSRLQGHPTPHCPGVEAATGALGQGLSFSTGLALAAKLKKVSWRVYTLLGDGEIHEGQVWEAAMTAAKYKLDNLTAIIDANNISQSGTLDEIKPIAPVVAKWKAFGWNCLDIDGHDFSQLIDAFEAAINYHGGPSMIVARTVKGKGVSFLENAMGWHGKALNPDQAEKAYEELS